ncbi:serine/arginine-rich splicing factor SR45a [Selaginella moellendorffii]|nr:serine/arginine-rich splicing factor SR45a [Selaginella moellendorffii]|eukprot:XP_002992560.2 serine/arginine-rich splicing factor SR45a [Selaginella moellendorffii]
MDTVEDADRCIKYLHRSNLDGRSITVEKAKRKRARTPTPGKYLGVRSAREVSYSRRRSEYRHSSRRGYSPSSRGRRERSASPGYSPYRSPRRGRSYRRSSYCSSRSRSASSY